MHPVVMKSLVIASSDITMKLKVAAIQRNQRIESRKKEQQVTSKFLTQYLYATRIYTCDNININSLF